MQRVIFDIEQWRSWDVERRPVIPEGMPVLIDDDLVFEDAAGPRATVVANRWLRELPSSGCPAPKSWRYYAQALRAWLEFLGERGIAVFAGREELRSALGAYAAHRSVGPVAARFEASTWNQHVSILSSFYRWAVAEGYAGAEPFSYRQARVAYSDQVREAAVNRARLRTPKPHVTIKYFEADFADLFVRALSGLGPDGEQDGGFRGRESVRNGAVGRLALSTGLRCQEFTYLLAVEVPAVPGRATRLPVPFPVPAGVTKGRKGRTTWIDYAALAEVRQYVDLVRPLAAVGSSWSPPRSWGAPLVVTDADAEGGRVDGARVRWASLVPAERRRLIAPDGGSMLLAVRGDGGPFTAWPTVFARTAERVRERFEPRFPTANPHRLRHTFALATLERLVGGYYAQAARLVRDTGADAALALYLAKADPLMVLRDLLGHSSVLTTEKYLNRLDITRIYKDAYERAGVDAGPDSGAQPRREADDEFDGEAD
jgi:integrase